MEFREYQAKTLDEAITAASVDLGVPSSELHYEIIEKGSAGILGFGKKDLVIKAIRKSDMTETEVAKPEVKSYEKAEEKPLVSNKEEQIKEPSFEVKENREPVDVELVTGIAKDFLKEVFDAMGLVVETEIKFSEKDNSLSIDLSGEHMGIIIGKRGQTLDSLQYLVNLVVNKKSDSYVRIKLDTEDYRRRRKETLENLAKNIAHKVKRSGKPVTLEAMNPYERRTIHYALQKDRYVTTYSDGEEPYRHVVITVKK